MSLLQAYVFLLKLPGKPQWFILYRSTGSVLLALLIPSRYVLFQREAQLADYYAQLLRVISSFPNDISQRRSLISQFDQSWKRNVDTVDFKNLLSTFPDNVTLAIPSLQMSVYGMHHDEQHLSEIFDSVSRILPPRQIWISSPYLNFTNRLKTVLFKYLQRDDASLNILTASPSANGFYNSKGSWRRS